MGNSDAHRDPDPVGSPQTVVLADDLTREAIQAGIRAGHSYVAESKDVALKFTATGGRGKHAGIGERLYVEQDAPVTVRLDVTGAPGCTARFVTDQGVLFTGPAMPASGTGTVEWRTTPSYAAYVRAEVRHAPATTGPARAADGVHEPDLPGPELARPAPARPRTARERVSQRRPAPGCPAAGPRRGRTPGSCGASPA